MTTARSRPALRLAVASGVDLAAAIDAFLSQPDLASTTRAKYRQTLTVLEDELGDTPITGAALAGVQRRGRVKRSDSGEQRRAARRAAVRPTPAGSGARPLQESYFAGWDTDPSRALKLC